jgi:cytidylate kinase
MIRVITIGREFGSGGALIAAIVAKRLGWKLLDKALVEEIARVAQINPSLAERYDECLDPWFHRLAKAMWQGGYEGVATSVERVFDADAMAALYRRVIEEAASIGNCVTVGRGGQCFLQNRKDVFHVFVYAPLEEKIERLRERISDPNADLAALAEETDRMRATYVKRYFGWEWTNHHLYDLMISSSVGLEAAASAILAAAGLAGGKA